MNWLAHIVVLINPPCASSVTVARLAAGAVYTEARPGFVSGFVWCFFLCFCSIFVYKCQKMWSRPGDLLFSWCCVSLGKKKKKQWLFIFFSLPFQSGGRTRDNGVGHKLGDTMQGGGIVSPPNRPLFSLLAKLASGWTPLPPSVGGTFILNS